MVARMARSARLRSSSVAAALLNGTQPFNLSVPACSSGRGRGHVVADNHEKSESRRTQSSVPSFLSAALRALRAGRKSQHRGGPAKFNRNILGPVRQSSTRRPVKLSTLKPGDVVEGKLSRSVYANDRLLFPAASRVRLTVDKLEVRRKAPNDQWPWVVKAFAPRHEKYPTLHSAQVSLAGGVVFDRPATLTISQTIAAVPE